MAESFGSYLQELRVAQKLTTAQLARMAGVQRSTLSDWQTDKHRPRLPELDAVLGALGVSDHQKQQARETLRTPAALLRLRTEGSDPQQKSFPGHAPHGGDLIRAMRMRRGWTQSDLAQRLGVSQATVVRWERAEQWPSTQQLHLLCYLLQAYEDELVALTLGRFSLAAGDVRLTVEEIQERLDAIFEARFHPQESVLAELRLLGLMGHAWHLAARGRSGQQMLAKLNSNYADHLYLHHRFGECRTIALQALDIYSESGCQDDGVNRAAIRLAEASVKAGGQKGLNSAIEILENWRFHRADPKNAVVQSAWILGDLARFKAKRGEIDTAMALGQQALRESDGGETSVEYLFRGYDVAEVLLDANRPQESYEFLQGISRPHVYFVDPKKKKRNQIVDPRIHPHFHIVDARIQLILGNHTAANTLLQEAQGWLDTIQNVTGPEISYYRPTVEAVSEQVMHSAMQPQTTSVSFH